MDQLTFSKRIFDELMNEEIRSINENAERPFILCQDQIIPISGKWDGQTLRMTADKKYIEHECGSKPKFVGHTHILGSALPSDEDFEGYRNLPIKADGFCTVGLDKVLCFDKDNHLLLDAPWSDEFDRLFEQHGGKVFRGKNLFCDNFRDTQYCELNGIQEIVKKNPFNETIVEKKNVKTPIGIFKTITATGGSIAMNTKDADLGLYSNFQNQDIACYAKDGIPDLACFVKTRLNPV